MYCSNCGNKLPDDAKYCDACGVAVEPPEDEDFQFVEDFIRKHVSKKCSIR